MLVTNSNPIVNPVIPTGGNKNKNKKSTKMSLGDFQNFGVSTQKTQSVDATLTSSEVLKNFDATVRAYRPDPREFYHRYNGTINSNCGKPQYVYIQNVADDILFSQKEVSDFNTVGECDYPISELADKIFVEFKRTIAKQDDGVLDIVNMGKGEFTSVDNRRLLIAKKIGKIDGNYGIWVRVHGYNDSLNRGLQQRFGGAKTWGEAVEKRLGNSRFNGNGYSNYPTIMTQDATGKKVKAPSQEILLEVGDLDLSELDSRDVKAIKAKTFQGNIKI